MLDKSYTHKDVEEKIYDLWENSGAFKPSKDHSKDKDAYTIVIPPPNITGSLHMGHALNNTVQDILIRYHRMKGLDVLWQPGTDHASIAAQMVVERQLEAKNLPGRVEMGRDAFIAKVWEWKHESNGIITDQLKKLGASCDWSRERFTMDEGLSHAVLKTFVELYNEGLIYRDKRLVNWDPKMQTAISDLEVIPTDIDGHMWYFSYPIKNGKTGEEIPIATTRPETMLGDVAVAVHPDDDRYKHLIGKTALHPITQNELIIIGDDFADPEQGTGAVKITPAHDFNDFEVGLRHQLPMINIMTKVACLNENVPAEYQGLDRFVAREKIIKSMQELGFYSHVEPHRHTVPFGERGGVPVEPMLTDQWFLNAKILAAPAIKAVQQGRVKFVPENWQKTYFEWMNNIQPWCISRQLWWGHQIPAWYGEDGHIFVAMDENEAMEKARDHYEHDDIVLRRDSDVLDTWFSSALWPFSTLGWPDTNDKILQKHYPTNVLVTGFDIIFFWVARMMMFGLHFMKDIPFDTVYVHALVRDEKGQKMSKSKGNVINPLELTDQYGADALRFTLSSLAAPGRDIKLAASKVEMGRNFITKLWNAVRFLEMNECKLSDDFDANTPTSPLNKWIIASVIELKKDIEANIETYRFHDASARLYHFVWGLYCDWYIEFSKSIFNDGTSHLQQETKQTSVWVLQQILSLLHPFTPFVTEKLWHDFLHKGDNLITSTWPDYTNIAKDDTAVKQMNWTITVIENIRSARQQLNIAPKLILPLKIINLADDKKIWLNENNGFIQKLARLDTIEHVNDIPSQSMQVVVDEAIFAAPLKGMIDIQAEMSRVENNLQKVQKEMDMLNKKLSNENFLQKAAPAVIDEAREKLSAFKTESDKLNEILKLLKE